MRDRRALHADLVALNDRAIVQGATYGVVDVDIDHLLHLNAAQGHAIGDDALTRAMDAMEAALRGDEALYRTGGEEFLGVAAGADLASSTEFAERLRAALHEARIPHGVDPGGEHLTASFGVAVGPAGSTATWDETVDRAHRCLIRAKREGRDRVETTPM
ncbi:MAG: GGDEF domain-containing protein [Candidatus Nanopelagicales bacterium]